MKVKLRNPDREVEVSGPRTVAALLAELNIVPEAVLVIREATLLTRDESLTESDEVEVRPVLSGGSHDRGEQTGAPRAENRS
jgi:sulfur carrier protein